MTERSNVISRGLLFQALIVPVALGGEPPSEAVLVRVDATTEIVVISRNGISIPTVRRQPKEAGIERRPLGAASPIENGDFTNGLTGWTVEQFGGLAMPGQVVADMGQAVVSEGDSFLVTLRQTFVVPDHLGSGSFQLFFTPGFDTTANFIPDAFEVSLLDAQNVPVVPTWDPFATSFFNVQETDPATPNLAPQGVTWDGATATVDVSGVPGGTQVTLFFDFIGADSDIGGALRLDNVDTVFSGACCLPAGACQELTEQDCLSQSGTYQADQTECGLQGCGACCFAEDDSCQPDLTAISCALLDGFYQGQGSECAAVDCTLAGVPAASAPGVLAMALFLCCFGVAIIRRAANGTQRG